MSEQSDRWRKENLERSNEIAREYRQRNLEKIRLADQNRDLIRSFGITLDDYNQMATAQNGKCKICGGNELYGRKRLAVDHCHITGKIRGLLCIKCNAGLGMFTDNPDKLTAALSYLREYE